MDINEYKDIIDDLKHCKEVGNIIFQIPEDERIIDTLIEALEKQVAKKVKNKKESDFFGYTAHCPNCKITIVSSFNSNGCGHCGQKLNWD